tara:strand:- start:13 stop:462 length:450 start_codon:yes stop_codon:yes gene_type:complete
MGGSNDSSNLVELTTEEHALAHKKLYEEHGNINDKIAYLALSGQIGNEEARIMAVKEANTGRKQSKEHIINRSKSLKGRKGWNEGLTKETNKSLERLSNNMMGDKNHNYGKVGTFSGRKHTEETLQKMRGPRKHYKKRSNTTLKEKQHG